MQAYNPAFAKVYNLRWTNFAQQVAPRLRAYYESTSLGQHNRMMLDLCCGTGQLAQHFLDNGYQVTGIDLSEGMLEYARGNNAAYILTEQARFIKGNAASFTLPERFGLVVSTFDALNHLPDLTELCSCFASVHQVLEEEGVFIFDLNTLEGLRRWTSITIEDQKDMMLVNRGVFDEHSGRAYTYISGFIRIGDNLYERFEETAFNTGFHLKDVEQGLLQSGFRAVRFCRLQDLNTPVEDPERESRIFVLAVK